MLKRQVCVADKSTRAGVCLKSLYVAKNGFSVALFRVRIIPNFKRKRAKSQIINKTINAEKKAQRDRERPANSYIMTPL